jgi:hypothetical protein
MSIGFQVEQDARFFDSRMALARGLFGVENHSTAEQSAG